MHSQHCVAGGLADATHLAGEAEVIESTVFV